MCTDFIILKGLYIKKKTNKEKKNKEKNSPIYRTHHSHAQDHVVYDTAQIRKTDFVF